MYNSQLNLFNPHCKNKIFPTFLCFRLSSQQDQSRQSRRSFSSESFMKSSKIARPLGHSVTHSEIESAGVWGQLSMYDKYKTCNWQKKDINVKKICLSRSAINAWFDESLRESIKTGLALTASKAIVDISSVSYSRNEYEQWGRSWMLTMEPHFEKISMRSSWEWPFMRPALHISKY